MSAPLPPKRGYSVKERRPFRSQLEHLKKKWPNAEQDVFAAIRNGALSKDPGNVIPNLEEFSGRVYKKRILSTDLKDGRRGGYRLIYLVSKDQMTVELTHVYCKKEQENIPTNRLLETLQQVVSATEVFCVEIVTDPECAEVWVEGEFVDHAPCTLKVPRGIHVVTCKIPPTRAIEHSFECDGSGNFEVRIEIP